MLRNVNSCFPGILSKLIHTGTSCESVAYCFKVLKMILRYYYFVLLFCLIRFKEIKCQVYGLEKEPVIEVFTAEKIICQGCPIPLDVNDPKLQQMVISALNKQKENEWGDLQVISATKEVVNGVLYTIKIEAKKEDGSKFTCDLEIVHRPWKNEKPVETIYNNCTKSDSDQSYNSELFSSEVSNSVNEVPVKRNETDTTENVTEIFYEHSTLTDDETTTNAIETITNEITSYTIDENMDSTTNIDVSELSTVI